jgi:hypothetical protein
VGNSLNPSLPAKAKKSRTAAEKVRPKRTTSVPVTARIAPAVRHDRKLIDHCLAGEPAAWTNLYRACHEPLLASIRAFLRAAAADTNLVDEIAARVWYAVVRNEGELLSRFDISRGCRLTTFLSVLGKSEARQYFRAERRRRTREEAASRPEGESHAAELLIASATEAEFVGTLTPSERLYYQSVLLAPVKDGADDDYSDENGWQLRRRVRKKLNQFLE